MIAVEVARQRVLDGLSPLSAEIVPLPQALGRVLAQDQSARVSHPPCDVSSMDGYALAMPDGKNTAFPLTLPIIGESAAGHPFAGRLQAGQAVRIFTGARIPDGADRVVIQEDVLRQDGQVTMAHSCPAKANIRPVGHDFTAGEVLLRAGTRMGPRQIALAAAMNIPWLPVRRRPRVAILSTGDEIVLPGEAVNLGQIPSSNGLALEALIQRAGGEPVQLGIARDSRESLTTMISAAYGCDLLVTSGGASVGDYDLVQDVLAAHGLKLDFWKIAMRPGKPLMSGTLRGVPVLGVSGNPVAAVVCGYLFLVPMINRLLGLPESPRSVRAILGTDVAGNDVREDYLRGTLSYDDNGQLVATPFDRQDSAMAAGLAAADCLIIRPPHALPASAGDAVTIIPLPAGE